MSYKILLVEDSLQICEVITDFFHNKAGDDYVFEIIHSGSEALGFSGEFDLALLDIMLPGASGYDICKAIRSKSECPIIFMTALGGDDSVVKGYDLGADDYIVKPFSMAQLFGKVQALIKRTNSPQKRTEFLKLHDIELDPVSMRIFVNGDEKQTTAKEYFLLKVLLENKDMVMTRDRLLTRIWGYDFDGNDRVVDTTVKRLRQTLGEAGKHIKTVIGRGYKIQ